MNLVGSEYVSEGGEVNSVDMLKSGSSFLSHDLNDTKSYAGSYAPIVKGVHQCGGKRSTKKNRKSNKKRQNKKKMPNKKLRQRKTMKKRTKNKKNKKGGDSCMKH